MHVAAGQGAAGCKVVSRTGPTYSDPHRGEIIIPDRVYIVKTVYTRSGVWNFISLIYFCVCERSFQRYAKNGFSVYPWDENRITDSVWNGLRACMAGSPFSIRRKTENA